MKKNMIDAGVYSIDDINEICRLEADFADACEKIAAECDEEGYPSRGENYELRCEQARVYYDEQIAIIDEKYDEV